MRIGLVLYGDLSSTSGGFLYDRYLVDALRREGDTVDVMSFPWPTHPAGVALGLERRLASRLRAWRGDLLLQDELAHPSLWRINRSLRRERSLPIVSVVHHLRISERTAARGLVRGLALRVKRRLVRSVESAYLESVHGFIFNSATTRKVVEDLLGRSLDGVVATPGGDRLSHDVTDEAISARSRCPGPLRVLFAGNFIQRKGLHVLIEALAMLPRGTCRLTAAGSRSPDPGYARRADRLVAARGLAGLVSFPGHLDDAALAAALAEHHVLAVPSAYEGFGIIYLEAMGFGVVPVASAAGGGAEIVEHGRSGYLVTPDDASGIANCLAGLAADRGTLSVMALQARSRYRAFPGWQESMACAVSFLHAFPRAFLRASQRRRSA